MKEICKEYDPNTKHTIGRMQRGIDSIVAATNRRRAEYPNGVIQLNGILWKRYVSISLQLSQRRRSEIKTHSYHSEYGR